MECQTSTGFKFWAITLAAAEEAERLRSLGLPRLLVPFPFVTDFHGQQIGAISLVVNSVVADQANNNYSVDAYLAVQVPEPSALILAALGGLALLVWRRRDP